MQKEHCELLRQQPLPPPLHWSKDPGHVQVAVRSSRTRPEPGDFAPPRVLPRKTLLVVDIVCLLLATIPFLICELGLVSPVRRGFFCNDSSISYPLQQTETITDLVLISVGIPIAFITITLGESFHVRTVPHSSRSIVSNPYVAALYKEMGAFFFGCAVSQSLTNMAKLAVGRLRPYFLAACRPNFTHIDCSAGYLEDYVCTGGASAEKEARFISRLSPALEFKKILLLWPCLLCNVYYGLSGVLPAGPVYMARCTNAAPIGPVCAPHGGSVHGADPHL